MFSHSDAFEVLCLQASDQGRGPVLFGDCVSRARNVLRPFFVGDDFPSVYFEFPLKGDPFLDVTVLYGRLPRGTRIASSAVQGTEATIDWFSSLGDQYKDVCLGFELDTKLEETPAAAIHFQPRKHTELVRPFFESLGEPERTDEYFELADRLPESWKPEFFGLFRGRPGSPLRVCGYLSKQETETCAREARHVEEVFERAGFLATNAEMLAQIRELMQVSDTLLDYQFDIYPDLTLSDTFALDIRFKTETTKAVHDSFCEGSAACIMELFERWSVADKRWEHIPQATFARAIPLTHENGKTDSYTFTLMPGWAKLRWCNGVLQPAKFYFYGNAGFLAKKDEKRRS